MNPILPMLFCFVFLLSTPLAFAHDFTNQQDWQIDRANFVINIDPILGKDVKISCDTRGNSVSSQMFAKLVIISVDNGREFSNDADNSIVKFHTDKLIRVTCVSIMINDPSNGELQATYEFHPSGDDEIDYTNPVEFREDSDDNNDSSDDSTGDGTKKSNGGCNDCTPPTLGYSGGIKKVDNGVCINDSCMDGGKYHTEYPMQNTLLYFPNTVSLKYYENNGPSNMKMAQLGLGVHEIGSPISQSQALIEVWLNPFKGDMYNPTIHEIKTIDLDGILSWSDATVSLVPCMMNNTSNNCLEFNFEFAYAKPPQSAVLASNAWDIPRNTINNYFNDGLHVIYSPESIIPTILPEETLEECHYKSIQNRNNSCQFLTLIEYEKNKAQAYLDSFQ